MKWINIKDQLPPVSYKRIPETNRSDDPIPLLVRIYDAEDGGVNIFVGIYIEDHKKSKTTERTFINGESITTTREVNIPFNYISPRCRFGNYCSDAEIDLEKVTHWMLIEDNGS